MADAKNGLHGALIGTGPDGAAIGSLSQHQIQGAQHHGFSRAGFARDDVATGLEFQREVAHEGEVFDAQSGQHVRISSHR